MSRLGNDIAPPCFVGNLVIEQLRDCWMLREPLSYVTSLGWRIDVPVGFITDLASTPQVVWSLFPPTDEAYMGAAIIHDYLYSNHRVSRIAADEILREAACVQGCSWMRRKFIYAAVRAGGAEAYDTGPERQVALRKRLAAMGLS